VVWLGANEFRANYGNLYDGGKPDSLIDGLLDDLGRVLDFVKKKNSKAQIVIALVPDLGATPTKREAHPDPLHRARVTAATVKANLGIAKLAANKGAGVADTYSRTAALIAGKPLFYGAVEIIDDVNADNDPRFAFTRDGLHPNTALQIENARAVINAFNTKFKAGLPAITDAQALALLGISPNEPFYDWLASFGIADKSFIADDDGDGLTRLVEFAFGLDPTKSDTLPLKYVASPTQLRVDYSPVAARSRSVRVQPQWSLNRVTWRDVAAARVVTHRGVVSAAFLSAEGPYHRLKVSTVPPDGSKVSVFTTAPLN
jgi:hypothetical protein